MGKSADSRYASCMMLTDLRSLRMQPPSNRQGKLAHAHAAGCLTLSTRIDGMRWSNEKSLPVFLQAGRQAGRYGRRIPSATKTDGQTGRSWIRPKLATKRDAKGPVAHALWTNEAKVYQITNISCLTEVDHAALQRHEMLQCSYTRIACGQVSNYKYVRRVQHMPLEVMNVAAYRFGMLCGMCDGLEVGTRLPCWVFAATLQHGSSSSSSSPASSSCYARALSCCNSIAPSSGK